MTPDGRWLSMIFALQCQLDTDGPTSAPSGIPPIVIFPAWRSKAEYDLVGPTDWAWASRAIATTAAMLAVAMRMKSR